MRSPVVTLTRRADFLAAAQSTQKFIKPSVIIQCRTRTAADNAFLTDATSIRSGFTATRKLGGAVVRNRAKRRLRAAVRQLLPELGMEGHDYVFIGRAQTLLCPYDALIRDMKHALKRLAAPAAPLSTPPDCAP